jgi:PDZ domain-containing protein
MNWLRSPLILGNCILLFGVTAAIGGCAAPMKFENAESANTFEQDKYDCEVLLGYRGPAGETEPTDHLADYLVFHRLKTEACLERKGWRRTDGEVQAKMSQPGEQPKAEVSTFKVKFGIVPETEVTPTIADLLKMDEVGGVLVAAVYADSVASRAGIKKGDVILKYGEKILRTDPNQLKAAVEATPPGSVVPITIWRHESKIALSAQF